VGGVSERAGVRAGGSNPFAWLPHGRGGRRHPGFLEGGALRGASSERRPRSVRWTVAGSSRDGRRADDSGCPEDAEEGNVVAHAHSKRMHRRAHERSCSRFGRRVLRSVLRPARVNPHYTRGAKSVLVVGRTLRHHGWASPRKREEPTLGSDGRTQRGSPRVTASARERAWHVRKGRGSRPPSQRGSRVPVGCSNVVVVAEVCRRSLVSNKLGKRAPKRAVRVE
jgi:hypothetical protein